MIMKAIVYFNRFKELENAVVLASAYSFTEFSNVNTLKLDNYVVFGTAIGLPKHSEYK